MDDNNFFIVSNGKRVLHLYPAEEGGYNVLCPYDPALITEADTIEEAFEMAEDAAETLAAARKVKYGPKKKSTPRKKPSRARSKSANAV